MRELRRILIASLLLGLVSMFPSASAQQLAKRLILKDGSYQLSTQWEVKGDRVRYFSAERGEWEEVPKSMVDWAATDKYEKDRASGKPAPEAVELDKELEAERQAEEAKTPHVAPGLQLPDSGGVVLLDTFQNQPQLDELQQSGGELKKNMKGNILRAAINPIASAKQTIEIPGPHAKVQAHITLPAIYVNVDQQDQPVESQQPQKEPELPWDRFKIVRMQEKQGKRIAGDIKIAVYGKVSQEQRVKVTPSAPLATGEYAVVELLGKEGMNFYVWDFGVNPTAPANPMAWKPDGSATTPPPEKPKDLQQRQ